MSRHLNLKERTEIMKGLNLGKNISSIATDLEYNKSTIAREIKKRRKFIS